MAREGSIQPAPEKGAVYLSIGIIAWNEEAAICPMLRSVLSQSLFGVLKARGMRCELFCVANGCTDKTAETALKIFKEEAVGNPNADAILFHVAELQERGKYNAWNEFVHRLSAPETKYLFLMDADILIHEPETLKNMVETLETNPECAVAVDRPCKNIGFKEHISARERLSLAASEATTNTPAQLCGQLYCIRSAVARNIYLPKDLAACEDGFIKAMACTNFGEHAVAPDRIRLAPGAAHTFEAYTSVPSILRNQKRQVIGQTMVHVLVDQFLPRLSKTERCSLAETLRRKDAHEPQWLKRMVSEHVRRTAVPWKLYPGLTGQRFNGLRRFGWRQLLPALPGAVAGWLALLVASFLARRFLLSGSTHYWPKAQRTGLDPLMPPEPGALKPAIGTMKN